ncbi:MAG: hypothetical protein GC153_08270 [Alphaproteobacteria bacterium]|nr:hypothetical protein [Alphaproteobacteria bacterium]
MLTRLLAGIGAIACWTGLAIQLFILMTGPLGIAGGVWRFLAFFTVLMNLLAALLFSADALRPELSPSRARLQTASAVYMTFLGVVYVTLLQNLWDPQGLQFIADALLHYAGPAAAALFWIICTPKSAVRWSDIPRWTVVPLAYLVYALLRAQVDGFYPYPFIDVSQLGWPRVLSNSAGMLVAFVVLESAFVGIAKATSRRRLNVEAGQRRWRR